MKSQVLGVTESLSEPGGDGGDGGRLEGDAP